MTQEEIDETDQFENWLLHVGEGLKDGDEEYFLRLPQNCCILHGPEDSL